MNRHSIVKTQGVHHSTYNIWLKVFYDMSFNSRGHVLAKGLKYTRPSIAVDVLTSSEELITLQRLLGVFIQKCLPPITMWCYTHAHCTVCDNYSWLELFLLWSVGILAWVSNVYTLGKLPKPKSKENTTFGIFLQGPQGECDASPKSKLKKHKVAEHEKKNGFELMRFL